MAFGCGTALPLTAADGSQTPVLTRTRRCRCRSGRPPTADRRPPTADRRPPTADTGVDALTHAVEAYVSRKVDPSSDGLALNAIRTIGRHLRRVFADGGDLEAREATMLVVARAGIAFSHSSVTLVHGMSRPVGAHFRVARGLPNAVPFPAVSAFSGPAAESRYADLCVLCSRPRSHHRRPTATPWPSTGS